MAITIQSSRENDDDKTVFFTIGYKGTDYKWHGDMPKDAEAQDNLDAKSDTLKVGLLRKQYFDAVVPQLDDKSALESFEAWVSAGCKNAEVKEEVKIEVSVGRYETREIVITPEKAIEKKVWRDTH